MIKLLIRWIITAVALFVAALLLPGIQVGGVAWITFGVTAFALGLVNALVRPILKLLTCPLRLLTLGLFTLVINGFVLWLAAVLSGVVAQWFDLPIAFRVADFWSAFLGALIVSVVTIILSALVREDK